MLSVKLLRKYGIPVVKSPTSTRATLLFMDNLSSPNNMVLMDNLGVYILFAEVMST
jgi:hypothetical protein